MPEIDETAYREGREAFDKGKTLHDMAAQFAGDDGVDDAAQTRAFSRLLGFGDGFLSALRAVTTRGGVVQVPRSRR